MADRVGLEAPFAGAAYDVPAAAAGAPPLRIEPLSAEGAHRLGAVFAAMEPWVRYPYPAPKLEAYLSAREAGAPRFGLVTDGGLVGALGLRLDWLRGPFLQFLGVVPAAQQHGLGGRVLAWLEGEARRGQQRNVWVTVSDFNVRAASFYARHGFVETCRLDDLVSDGRSELLMRKRLV